MIDDFRDALAGLTIPKWIVRAGHG